MLRYGRAFETPCLKHDMIFVGSFRKEKKKIYPLILTCNSTHLPAALPFPGTLLQALRIAAVPSVCGSSSQSLEASGHALPVPSTDST